MHSRCRRVCAQIASVPLVRLVPVTISQKLSSAKELVSRQSKTNLLIPKPRKQTKKESGSAWKEVTTNTDPPPVARLPTHLTNNFMGITSCIGSLDKLE